MALAHEICLTRTTLRHGVHMHQSLHYRNRLCTRRRRHLGSSAGSGPALARPVSAQYFIRWALRKSQTSDRHQSAIVQSLLLPRASRMACRLCRCTAQRRPPLSPPSTTRSCPLMKDDPSAARKTAASAMSSTDPARGMGCALENAASTAPVAASALSASTPNALAKTPVGIAPGDMLFTRTLCSPSCMATHRVKWMTPAFAAP
jgi:hypothetical protein